MAIFIVACACFISRLQSNFTDWYAGGQCPPYGRAKVLAISQCFFERAIRLKFRWARHNGG
ncbi:hypothetical protein [Coleofasciculus sp. F4-SAH-05]|uniref:hypothetical protein n=1 Tax=Coleofasciculus sp. F4-SAH-05 TaxID=3069525 RepID=UPI0032FA982C